MRKMNEIIPQIILLVLLAVGLLALVWLQENWPLPVRLTLALGALIFLSMAIAAIIAWMQYNAAVISIKRAEAAAITPQVRLVMELRHLNSEQINALGKYHQVVEIAGGDVDVTSIPYWPLMGGGRMAVAFIRRLIDLGDEDNLPAIRDLDDCDIEPARQVIADFTQRGWISPARGNQTAKWLDRDAAEHQIFGGEE